MRNSKGFTLVEIIVAVALVAILSAAIAPSVLNNIAMGRMARAQSDVQALAAGIMQFRVEVGLYPNLQTPGPAIDGSINYVDKVKFLATLGPVNWDNNETGADVDDPHWAKAIGDVVPNESAGKWHDYAGTGFAPGDVEPFFYHLMRGRSLDADPGLQMYPTVAPGFEEDITIAGFRSAVITSDPLDPWGNRYMCNVGALGIQGENVWVISAGPNETFNTDVALDGTGATAVLGDDDIGVKIQ